MPRQSNTSELLLDEAQRLVQTVGYNAFSYRDLASAVDVKTASIHYHFPTKADLGVALMRRYTEESRLDLARIDRGASTAKAKLSRFVEGYQRTLANGNRICLCGSLAGEIQTLEPALRDAVRSYFDLTAAWVESVIREGIANGEWRQPGPKAPRPAALARTLVASMQGALQFARIAGEGRLLKDVERQFLALLDS
jgi:TetR/AcrR family transcriptional repressor of nem operon